MSRSPREPNESDDGSEDDPGRELSPDPAAAADAEPGDSGGLAPGSDPGRRGLDALLARLPGRLADDPTLTAVLAVTLLGLLARLAVLGRRVAHFDEGRVAYWAMEYLETGAFHYRYIIHGPLAQHVDRWLFALVGPNDFTMRLFVALVGAALPLVALLFRRRLRPAETVLVAGLLAFNPILLYYSRFYRSTILVAAFMTAALGVGIRALDDDRPALLLWAGVLVGLGLASKENAVVYVLCWLGAGGLLLDYSLLNPARDATGSDLLRRKLAPVSRALSDPDRRQDLLLWAGVATVSALVVAYGVVSGTLWLALVWVLPLYVAGVLFVDRAYPQTAATTWGSAVLGGFGLCFVVAFFFYAPRDPGGVGFWSTLANPTQFPELWAKTAEDVRVGLEYWFGGSTEPGCNKDNLIAGWACYQGKFLQTLGSYALVLSLFSVLGFLIERWGTERPRPLVMLASYWGFVSVVGYPLGTDIYGAWITVNAIVPLAIPAAVALGLLARWGREALADEDQVATVLTVVLAVTLVGQVAMAGVGGVYLHPTADDNELVQWAQPQQEMRPVIEDLDRIAPENEGVDLLLHGEELTVPADEAAGLAPPCTRMVKTLPIQWYIRKGDWTTECAYDEAALENHLANSTPAVVITHVRNEQLMDSHLSGYEKRYFHLRTLGREVVVYTRAEYVDGSRGE